MKDIKKQAKIIQREMDGVAEDLVKKAKSAARKMRKKINKVTNEK